jgi:hypothetical protein
MGSGGIAPRILNLGRGKWSVSSPGHYTPRKESSVPLERRLCGPQACLNGVRKRTSHFGEVFK